MRTPSYLFIVMAVFAIGLSGCSSVPDQSPISAANGPDPYHVIRTEQLQPIESGAVVGVITGASPTPLGLFMGAALDSRGLVVREMSLYTLLPPGELSIIAPEDCYTFLNTLVEETFRVAQANAKRRAESDEVGLTDNLDLNIVVDRLFEIDDIVAEEQRVNHYLQLVTGLQAMVNRLNVDYIVVVGAPYAGLSYSTRIYDTETMNVVFRDLIVSDENEWRRMVPAPAMDDRISYDYSPEKEPQPYWDLSYAEFVVSKLNVQ